MFKEVGIFALLVFVRWQLGVLYPVLTSHLLEWAFTGLVLLSGICYALDKYLKKYPLRTLDTVDSPKNPLRALWIQAQGLAVYFLPLLLIFVLRSFVFDTNYVVSGSMKPTLKIGDIALVKKYSYGVRLPLTWTLLVPFSTPQRGDIITFRFPLDESKIFIKRVIGLPGDRIQYIQKCLTINGEKVPQHLLGITQDEEYGLHNTIMRSEEHLQKHKYTTYTLLDDSIQGVGSHAQNAYTQKSSWVIPKGQYFVIGDNRDNSLDSRHWGCVSEHLLVGKAYCVVLSADQKASWLNPLDWIRWQRIGTKLD